MAVIGIVAVARNGAIGRGGGLPWHYPADLKFFKEQTSGHACLMGHKTWLSLRRPLPNRLNVVLSRRAEPEPCESVVWLRDAVSAYSLAGYLRCDLYVLGGARVFADFAGRIERWVVTEIPHAVEDADTFMPPDFLAGFEEDESRHLGDGLTVRFYRRAAVQTSAPA
ncbi:MAG TPA: dihydrofolate reductase [Pyrinomonadaceae bacterium]|nr:dihydrofolate reductase [Pyrinomonadaceae bacterium]